jgi:hypothetical protein
MAGIFCISSIIMGIDLSLIAKTSSLKMDGRLEYFKNKSELKKLKNGEFGKRAFRRVDFPVCLGPNKKQLFCLVKDKSIDLIMFCILRYIIIVFQKQQFIKIRFLGTTGAQKSIYIDFRDSEELKKKWW